WPLRDLGWFVADLVQSVKGRLPHAAFSSGFAVGEVVLDEIAAGQYREWTVYGNCVNGAKRLQSLPRPENRARTLDAYYRLTVGAIESEAPQIVDELNEWIKSDISRIPLTLVAPVIECQPLKGVGRMCYVDTGLEIRS